MSNQAELLPGTLDLLILKAVSLGPLHGYGILLRIEQISGRALLIEQGALYPALFRLVGAPSFMNSPLRDASVCERKLTAGTAWSRPLPPPSRRNRSKHEE